MTTTTVGTPITAGTITTMATTGKSTSSIEKTVSPRGRARAAAALALLLGAFHANGDFYTKFTNVPSSGRSLRRL